VRTPAKLKAEIIEDQVARLRRTEQDIPRAPRPQDEREPPENGNAHVVEAFARSGLVRVKLRIHIDGRKVAGEDF
jgi:hypothetical protein